LDYLLGTLWLFGLRLQLSLRSLGTM
jgi:hypothetical protein